ncbi:hypothetical protein SAMN05421504_10259 [Amycolatopsis xylanica]|uniref:Lipoprotein n=1 Tax=Amycolatopsis xylanica TaxID=589385 RepID=A0A1H2Y9V0_9PSEU|nr:hypothetical protein [Amycolatopsis xylanica]SDX01821.1 hypothetical protein SAMN05421504_10259 [Amycolatopsis xylanica]
MGKKSLAALMAVLAVSGCTSSTFSRLTPAEQETRGSGELAADLLGALHERGVQTTDSASARISDIDHAAALITDGDRHGMIEVRHGSMGQGDPECTRPQPCQTADVSEKKMVIIETPISVTIEVYLPDNGLTGTLTETKSTSRFWSGGPALAHLPLESMAAAALAADLIRY